jgi:hypothetical protein
MDRFTKYLGRPKPNTESARISYESDRPKYITFRRQAIDLGIIAFTTFAAVIVLNESANRQYSLAMAPHYNKGKNYAIASARWVKGKVDAYRNPVIDEAPAGLESDGPEVMLALENGDEPTLDIGIEEEATTIPSVGTVRLQTVGRSTTKPRKVTKWPDWNKSDEVKEEAAPLSADGGSETETIDEFPLQIEID